MIYRCETCRTNWYPYQTRAGVCVICNGGTVRMQADPDPQAELLYRHALAIEAETERSRQCHEQFELYYAAREHRRERPRAEA